jgi:hypothetical protein
MKAFAHLLAWGFVVTVLIYAVVNPQSGLVYHSPGAMLSVGMIGLGLCIQARQKMRAQSAAAAARRVDAR